MLSWTKKWLHAHILKSKMVVKKLKTFFAVAHKQGSGNEEELTSDGETNNDDEILEIVEDEGASDLHEGASPNSEGAPAKEGAPGALPTKSSEGALVIKRSKGAQRRASLRQSAINEQRV